MVQNTNRFKLRIGVHHGGLILIVKEIVKLLFQESLLWVPHMQSAIKGGQSHEWPLQVNENTVAPVIIQTPCQSFGVNRPSKHGHAHPTIP